MEFKTVLETLKTRILLLKEELRRIHNRKRPTEYLIFKTEKSYIRYYLKNRQRKGLKYISCREEKVLREYCQERFLDELEKKLPGQIVKLEKAARILQEAQDVQEIYDKMSDPVKKFATPRLYREKEMVEEFYRKARETPHNTQEFMDKYKTDKGDYVRSKSEKIIADMLFHEGIPYDYEQGVFLKKGGMRFPDFTILNTRTGKIYRWEHFGGMDEDGYRKKNTKKIADYENSGFIQGINLIMTFEIKEVPLNIEHIRKLMKTFLK